MTAECFYCGEVKPCRKNDISFTNGRGYDMEHIDYEWICQECDKAQTIIYIKERIEKDKQHKINQLNWRKERDKILKQNK